MWQRSLLDEVKASLATCIELYLEGVNELPAEERPRLLTRRTPWHVRAKLALMTRLSILPDKVKAVLLQDAYHLADLHPR